MASADEDITGLLAKRRCYCLNESSPQQFNHLFCGDHTLALKSSTDEQLLLHLEFGQTVSLRQICFGIPGDDTCPKTVKLILNKSNLDFAAVTDIPITQEVTLTPSASPTGELKYVPLSVAKWHRTNSITIFVEDNHGAEVSTLFSVKLFGSPLMGTDVSKIHNTGHQH